MAVQTLNETSKALLRGLEQKDNAQTITHMTTSAVQHHAVTVAKDIKEFYSNLDKALRVACRDGVDEFFMRISVDNKVATGNKIFDEDSFNKDFEEFKHKYNELAIWLQENIPSNVLAISELMGWQNKQHELLKLKQQQPNKNDSKYQKDEFEMIPMSGIDALNIVRQVKEVFNTALDEIVEQFVAEDKSQFQKVHFTDEEWNFLMMAHKFGLTNVSEFKTKIMNYRINSNTFDEAIQYESFDAYLESRAQRIRDRKHKIDSGIAYYNYNKDFDTNDAKVVAKSNMLKQLNTPENNLAMKLLIRYEASFDEYLKFKRNAAKDIQLL